MTTDESRTRSISWSTWRPLALFIAIYAVGLCILSGGVLDRLAMKGRAACGLIHSAIATEGIAGVRYPYLIKDESDRMIVLMTERFPYSLSPSPSHSLDEYPIYAIGLREGDPGFLVVPRVDDRPMQIATALDWGDKILLWGSYRTRPGEDRRHAHLVLDDAGESRVLRDRGLLRPLAVDDRTGTLVSIEERPVILGGQPKEAERPPQRLIFERLDAAGMPLEESVIDHPIRRLLTLSGDDQGHVYIARWQGEMVPPHYHFEAHLFLEKYSIPEQQILWSVQVNAEPAARDRLEKLELRHTPSEVRIEFERWITMEPDDPRGASQLRVQASTFDSASGRRIGDELSDDPARHAPQTHEVVLSGRRYAISTRLGFHRNCVGLTALEHP
jgi:hypothetical protein